MNVIKLFLLFALFIGVYGKFYLTFIKLMAIMSIIRLRFSSVVETTLLFENDDVIHKLYIKSMTFSSYYFFGLGELRRKYHCINQQIYVYTSSTPM